MNLDEYFESAKGRGVLATADKDGQVNLAMYARPYFMDDDTVTFIMAERLTHENLKSNPYAMRLIYFPKKNRNIRVSAFILRRLKRKRIPI